jgi:hypothetical protein
VSCDNEDILYGTWRLQNVSMNGEALDDSLQFNVIPKYTYYTFHYQNSLNVSTYVLGAPTSSADGYYIFLNNSTIKMKFTLLYQRYEIKAKIKKLNRKELHLEYDDKGNTYFLKLYPNY